MLKQAAQLLINNEESTPKKEAPKPIEVIEKEMVKKSSVPIATARTNPKFGIKETLERKETETETTETIEENLPDNTFSDEVLQEEWKLFLSDIGRKDIVIYSAIHSFKLATENKNSIVVLYPSDSAKAEFDKIFGIFLNNFKSKVNNFKIKVEYQQNIEVQRVDLALTENKKALFDQLAEEHPILRELDNLFRFDFS